MVEKLPCMTTTLHTLYTILLTKDTGSRSEDPIVRGLHVTYALARAVVFPNKHPNHRKRIDDSPHHLPYS